MSNAQTPAFASRAADIGNEPRFTVDQLFPRFAFRSPSQLPRLKARVLLLRAEP